MWEVAGSRLCFPQLIGHVAQNGAWGLWVSRCAGANSENKGAGLTEWLGPQRILGGGCESAVTCRCPFSGHCYPGCPLNLWSQKIKCCGIKIRYLELRSTALAPQHHVLTGQKFTPSLARDLPAQLIPGSGEAAVRPGHTALALGATLCGVGTRILVLCVTSARIWMCPSSWDRCGCGQCAPAAPTVQLCDLRGPIIPPSPSFCGRKMGMMYYAPGCCKDSKDCFSAKAFVS